MDEHLVKYILVGFFTILAVFLSQVSKEDVNNFLERLRKNKKVKKTEGFSLQKRLS
jgi:hypothetical protein